MRAVPAPRPSRPSWHRRRGMLMMGGVRRRIPRMNDAPRFGLTAVCYFFFARRAFASALVGAIAGLFAALHPFWIINTAELADGVLATFLLAVVLVLGARGSHSGGAVASLLYGLALAGLALVR